MDAVLAFQEGITLSTEVRMSNESAAILKSELKIGDGKTVTLSPLATRLIEAVDGKRDLGDIVAKLASMLGAERLPDGELHKLKDKVAQLFQLGVLRLLPRDRRVTKRADLEKERRLAGKALVPEDVLQRDLTSAARNRGNAQGCG